MGKKKSVIQSSNTNKAADPQLATPEQIINYLKIADGVSLVYGKLKASYILPIFAKQLMLMLSDEIDFLWDGKDSRPEEERISTQTKKIASAFTMALLAIVTRQLYKKILEYQTNEKSFLPYFSKDISKKVEQLYSETINSKKLQELVKSEESNRYYYYSITLFIDLVRGYFMADEAYHLGYSSYLYSQYGYNTSISLKRLSLKIFPSTLLFEIARRTYSYAYPKKTQKEYLDQLKEWSHCDLWQQKGETIGGSYFFDLPLHETGEEISITLNEQKFKMPAKIYLRELTAAFLKMGLPVIFFNNSRLIIQDWGDENLKDTKSTLLHLKKSLLLWHKISNNKKKKLNQLKYISEQLVEATSYRDPGKWQSSYYRTSDDLPAIYFSLDISMYEKEKVQLLLTELQKIYGEKRVSINNDYIIVDGAKIKEDKIVFGPQNSSPPKIPALEKDTSSSRESKSQYRLPKTDKSEQNETTNANDNLNNKVETVADKIKAIKQQLKAKYPGHKVVPLNVPRKTSSREFALVEESTLKQTMDSNIKDSYQTFVSSLKNTAKVKSNNRGNGSSTTGLVDAVEPYRQLDGSWAISKRKFKLSNNTRVFFKSLPEETINGERVELTKATGFNSKYHRGRN